MIITGCATSFKPLPASEFLLYTNKGQKQVLEDLKLRLENNKYEIAKFDYAIGILSTKPRPFAVDKGSIKGEQTILIRQEAGSIKLRMQYRCSYVNTKYETGEEWQECNLRDEATIDKIEKLENLLLPFISEVLLKKTATQAAPMQDLKSPVRSYR